MNGFEGLRTGFGLLGYDVIKGTNIDDIYTVRLGIVEMFMSRFLITTTGIYLAIEETRYPCVNQE